MNKEKTYCGICPICGRMLTLITVEEYFTGAFRGYRSFCDNCNAKSKKTVQTVGKLIDLYGSPKE